MEQIPIVADGLLRGTVESGAAGLAVGSSEWFAWLAGDAARSFSFRSQQAERHLEAAWQLAEGQGLGWLRLRVLILRALLADAEGDREAALGTLAAAVAQAQPEGVVRPFLDEGAPMATLLAELRLAARDGRAPAGRVSPAYLGTLLAGFPGQQPEPHRTGLVEPLTERELEVLRLLAAGRSNAEMAADLFVEQSTVKTHLIHLYRKLGVGSRTQAVASARALGLLD